MTGLVLEDQCSMALLSDGGFELVAGSHPFSETPLGNVNTDFDLVLSPGDGEEDDNDDDAHIAQPHQNSHANRSTLSPRFKSIGFVCCFAAAHIIGYHLALWSEHGFFKWGYSWVSFFFVLSGFNLTHAQLRGGDPDKAEQAIPFLLRRLLRVYPLYALSLVLVPCVKSVTPRMLHLLPINVLLLQAWWPTDEVENAWNGPSWYISALASLWLFWLFAYPFVRALPTLTCCCVVGVITIGACGCFAGTALLCVWYGPVEWHETPLLRLVVHSPVSNAHLFFCGMCLAKLFTERVATPGVPKDFLTLKLGSQQYALSASVAFSSLCGLFMCADNRGKPVFILVSNGLLLPLQMLLLWGLASEEDPLARVFKRWPLSGGEAIYYGLYINQANVNTIAYQLFPLWDAKLQERLSHTVLFFCLLLPVSVGWAVMTDRLFDRPVQSWLSLSFREGVRTLHS